MFRRIVVSGCVVLATLTVARASADGDSEPAKTDGSSKSKTIATPPRPLTAGEIERLRTVARSLGSAVAQVGWLRDTEWDTPPRPNATAFVISRQHRLLATAAHVADRHIKDGGLVILLHGSKLPQRVQRVYYHPTVRRQFDEGLVARSMDPHDGKVALPGVDVAVLQLAEAGPELPAEFELGSDEELCELVSRPVASVGFPQSDNPDGKWPSPAFRLLPAFRIGRVARLVAFIPEQIEDRIVDASAEIERRRWVLSSMPGGYGVSGAPVFLENGHVIALHSGGEKNNNLDIQTTDLSVAEHVRVDWLRELLSYHRLGDQSGGPSSRGVERVNHEHERHLLNMREAVKLVRDAKAQLTAAQFREAGATCNRALALVPDYGNAYLQRSKVYLAFCATQWDVLPEAARRRFARQAWHDADRCWAVVTGRKAYRATKTYVDEFQELVGWSANSAAKSRAWQSEILSFRSHLRLLLSQTGIALTDAQEAVSLDPTNSVAFLSRGNASLATEEFDKALSDFAEALRLNPQEARAHLGSGMSWDGKGQLDRAVDSLSEAIRFDPDQAEMFSRRGLSLLKKRAFKAAIADLTEAIRIDARHAPAWAWRGWARWSQRDNAGAIVDYSEAIRLSPYAADLYADRGANRLATGDYERAIRDCTIAIGLNPQHFAVFNTRGVVWLSKSSYDKAIADLSDAIRINPKSTVAYQNRALAWKAKADPSKMLEDYTECIRLEPTSAVHHNTRAWLLAVCADPKFRDGPRAVQDATHACDLSDWKTADYVDTLAAAHAECGHFADAVKWQEKALELLTSSEDMKAPYRARLELYRAGKPYHETR